MTDNTKAEGPQTFSWMLGRSFTELIGGRRAPRGDCDLLACVLKNDLVAGETHRTFSSREQAVSALKSLAAVFSDEGQCFVSFKHQGVKTSVLDLRSGRVLACCEPDSPLMPVLLLDWSWPALCRTLGSAGAAGLAAALRDGDPECTLTALEETEGSDA